MGAPPRRRRSPRGSFPPNPKLCTFHPRRPGYLRLVRTRVRRGESKAAAAAAAKSGGEKKGSLFFPHLTPLLSVGRSVGRSCDGSKSGFSAAPRRTPVSQTTQLNPTRKSNSGRRQRRRSSLRRSTCARCCRDAQTGETKSTTLSGGSLGSCVDEERSQLRELM